MCQLLCKKEKFVTNLLRCLRWSMRQSRISTQKIQNVCANYASAAVFWFPRATMSDRKAVIKNADMSEDMQQDAVECATQALEKYNIEKDIAAFIKKVNPSSVPLFSQVFVFLSPGLTDD